MMGDVHDLIIRNKEWSRMVGGVISGMATYYVAKAIVVPVTTIAVCALGIRAASHYYRDPSRYQGTLKENAKVLRGDFKNDAGEIVRLAHAVSATFAASLYNFIQWNLARHY
jgi:hypothetical protein